MLHLHLPLAISSPIKHTLNLFSPIPLISSPFPLNHLYLFPFMYPILYPPLSPLSLILYPLLYFPILLAQYIHIKFPTLFSPFYSRHPSFPSALQSFSHFHPFSLSPFILCVSSILPFFPITLYFSSTLSFFPKIFLFPDPLPSSLYQ